MSLALFIVMALLPGCHRNGHTPVDHPQLAEGVIMRDVTFQSAALKQEMTYRVFLPEKRNVGEKFPVVYLLHGNGGGFREWSNDSNVATYAARGVILVMPEGRSSYYLNAVERPADKYEEYLTQDLITDIEGRFPARTGRSNRAIVGVSMGGFAAIKMALSHPELYVFAGAISPPIDAPQRKFSWKRAGQWWGFRAIFGPMDSDERKARNPFVLVQSAVLQVTPYIYLTAGEQEPLLEPIQRFESRLKQRGLAHEFHTRPGGHDWYEWDAQIPGCFASLFTNVVLNPGK